MANTIHLQSLGECPAILASDLKIGMKTSWNYSWKKHEVISIKEVTACFLEVTHKNVETGAITTRRMKKDRLVAAEF